MSCSKVDVSLFSSEMSSWWTVNNFESVYLTIFLSGCLPVSYFTVSDDCGMMVDTLNFVIIMFTLWSHLYNWILYNVFLYEHILKGIHVCVWLYFMHSLRPTVFWLMIIMMMIVLLLTLKMEKPQFWIYDWLSEGGNSNRHAHVATEHWEKWAEHCLGTSITECAKGQFRVEISCFRSFDLIINHWNICQPDKWSKRKMATTIEVVDGAAFQESMASVRNDTTEDRFIICGHVDGDPNRVQVRLKQVLFFFLFMHAYTEVLFCALALV